MRKLLGFYLGCMHNVPLRRHTIRAVSVCVYIVGSLTAGPGFRLHTSPQQNFVLFLTSLSCCNFRHHTRSELDSHTPILSFVHMSRGIDLGAI